MASNEEIISKGNKGGTVTVRVDGVLGASSANLNQCGVSGETVDSMNIKAIWWHANTGAFTINRTPAPAGPTSQILNLSGSGHMDFEHHGVVIETVGEAASNLEINYSGLAGTGTLIIKLKKQSTFVAEGAPF